MSKESELDTHNRKIGKKIRYLRRSRGLSQHQMAELLDVSYQQFQKYETGKNRISAASLVLLVEILDVPMTQFFSDIVTKGIAEETIDQMGMRLMRLYNTIPSTRLRKHLVASAKIFSEFPPS